MLYNWREHSSALFLLLTSTTSHALYIPRSTIITTTTTSRTTFIWSNQNQQFDSLNEDTPTLPFICFTCPMNPKLLREVRMFTPAVEIGPPSNDPEPRALLCEYDTNESPCRYDPATGMLLVDQPSGDSCARSASVSPECRSIVLKPSLPCHSSLLGDRNEPEAKSGSSLAPSSKENEQGRHSRDPAVKKDASEAIQNPKINSQRHFSAPDAELRHTDLEDDLENGLLNLDPKTPPPPSLNVPSTSPSPLDYDLDHHNAYDEGKDGDVSPIFEITPTVSTILSHDHDSDHAINLLFDLEFDDYSDALKLHQVVIPPPGPARGPREEWIDPVDEVVAYLMSITAGE